MIQQIIKWLGRSEKFKLTSSPKKPYDSTTELICVKRELGLGSAVVMTLGSIVGAGLFLSPKGVLMCTGSVGMSLVVWSVAGIVSMIGALCYIELGTCIPSSGSHFTYIKKCWGDFPAFLYLWVEVVILTPVAMIILSLTFANYMLETIFYQCVVPQGAVRLIAALPICILTFINCRNVQWVARLQGVFTAAKAFAIILIIVVGVYHLCKGNVQNFENAFQDTTTKPGFIALSFYYAFYAYGGWAFLNFVTEEVKDPSKNIPRNIYISIPLVTVIYILTNVAYLAVLTQVEMLSSNAVAVTFIQQFSPHASWAVSLCVATSTVGGMSGLLFTNSRLFFVASREGYLPSCLSMLNIYYFTPVPSLIFICVLSMSYLAITDVSVLMNYVGFVEALFLGVVMAGLVRLRYKQPNLERPIKVHISLPLIFLCVCIFLVALPFYERPWETGVGTAVTLTGVPVYMMILFCSGRPKLCERTAGKLTSVFQKVLLSVPEEKEN